MTEKQKFLRVCAGGFVLELILIGSAFSFHIFLIRPAHTNFSETKQTLSQLDQKESSLRSSLQEVEQRSNDFAILDAAFFNPDDAVPFITLLESMASRSGITLTIRAATDAGAINKKQAYFDLSIVGPLANSVKFLELLEHMPYFTDISSLTFSFQGGELRTQLRLTVLTL